MASIHRNPRVPNGNWYCAYVLANGRRAYRSTGQLDKEKAEIICQFWQLAENDSKDKKSKIFIRPNNLSEELTSSSDPAVHALHQPVVYLLKSGQYVKIGRSSKLGKRLCSYRICNPDHALLGIRTFKQMEDAKTFEESMHATFAQYRKESNENNNEKLNGTDWSHDCVAIRRTFVQATKGELIYLNYCNITINRKKRQRSKKVHVRVQAEAIAELQDDLRTELEERKQNLIETSANLNLEVGKTKEEEEEESE